ARPPAPALDLSWCRDRVALVTGAGSGIGRAVALALGRAGAQVGVHYRGNHRGAAAVVDEIRGGGGRAAALAADLSDPAGAQRLFEQLDETFDGPAHMLINNAGDWMDKRPILECDAAVWDRMFAVNARSVFLCCREAARRMVNASVEGAIVNVGSLAGHTGGGGG